MVDDSDPVDGLPIAKGDLDKIAISVVSVRVVPLVYNSFDGTELTTEGLVIADLEDPLHLYGIYSVVTEADIEMGKAWACKHARADDAGN